MRGGSLSTGVFGGHGGAHLRDGGAMPTGSVVFTVELASWTSCVLEEQSLRGMRYVPAHLTTGFMAGGKFPKKFNYPFKKLL